MKLTTAQHAGFIKFVITAKPQLIDRYLKVQATKTAKKKAPAKKK